MTKSIGGAGARIDVMDEKSGDEDRKKRKANKEKREKVQRTMKDVKTGCEWKQKNVNVGYTKCEWGGGGEERSGEAKESGTADTASNPEVGDYLFFFLQLCLF